MAKRGWRSLVDALRDPQRSDFAFVPHHYVHAPTELVDVSLSPGESTPINTRKDFSERARPWQQRNRFFVLHVAAVGCAAVCAAWPALFPVSAARLYDMQVDVFGGNHEHARFFLTQCLFLGHVLGAAAAGYLGDRLGRAGALELAAIPYVIGWLLVGLAYGEVTVTVGRYLLGVATGMMSVVAPIYLAEVSAARSRGCAVGALALFAAAGSLCYLALGALFLALSRESVGFSLSEWKVLAMAGLAPGLALLLAMQRLPDSPTWLITRHEDREAAFEIFARLYSGSYKSAEYQVNAVIHANVLAAQHRADRGAFARPLLLCGALFMLRAVCGFLLSPVLSSAKKAPAAFELTLLGVALDGGDASLLYAEAALWVAAGVGAACCLVLVDVRGRQVALQSGCYLVVGCCLVVLGSAYRATNVDGPLADYGSASVLLLAVGHQLGLGVVPVVVASELFPVKQRLGAMSVLVVGDALVRCALAAFALPLVRAQLHSLHALCVCVGAVLACNVAGVALAWGYLPETSQRSLQEIEAIFSGWQPATPQLGFSRVRLGGRHYGTSPDSV
ncbi:hypothetical protein PybrP1_000134 [[Pythium] brassicae (nom. inval.)]|nr:hypothetical protein PybrP1_000134 [[Pythium] brassicae (nom. inval.)]